MYSTDIKVLSKQFGLNELLIRSWFLKGEFYDIKGGINFFNDNIDTIKAKPFIKWVGGKRQLISQFEKIFPKEFNDYFEPFLGGGAVFFNLQKEKSFLSDINEELINAYQIIKENPIQLISFLKKIKHSKKKFLEVRAWDRKKGWPSNYSNIERAGRFIYLNKTCFNGLYRVNSKGQFNAPCGSYNNPDYVQEENIINSSELLNKTNSEIKVQGFEKVLNNAKSGDLVYFDPPYDVLTESANFTSYDKSGFGRDMQKKLRDIFVKLDKKGCKVMLSNHNTPFIRELYKGFKFKIVKANRMINSNANGRGKIKEIVILNY